MKGKYGRKGMQLGILGVAWSVIALTFFSSGASHSLPASDRDRLLSDIRPQRVLHYLCVNPDLKEHADWYRGRDTFRSHIPAFKRGKYEMHLPPYMRGKHEVVIHDQVSLPQITDEALKGFDQVWILELDYDSDIDVSDEAVAAVKRFYDHGGGVWVSFWGTEGKEDWTEDASRFSDALGIGYLRFYSTTMNTKASGTHPLMQDVHELHTWSNPAVLKMTNPKAKIVWAPAANEPIVACLDERAEGKGRIVVDGSVTMFYFCHPEWEHEKDKDLFHPDSERFTENTLRWLAKP